MNMAVKEQLLSSLLLLGTSRSTFGAYPKAGKQWSLPVVKFRIDFKMNRAGVGGWEVESGEGAEWRGEAGQAREKQIYYKHILWGQVT